MGKLLGTLYHTVMSWIASNALNADIHFDTRIENDVIQLRIIITSRVGDFPTEWFNVASVKAIESSIAVKP